MTKKAECHFCGGGIAWNAERSQWRHDDGTRSCGEKPWEEAMPKSGTVVKESA